MINEETIVSVYDDKMTLLQFLKTVNKALDEAVLTSVEVSKKGNATLSFVFEFADGTKIESGEIVLQQGESVTDAKIVDGHLYLTLSNDERLDAGNVKPVTRFEINASQHLIVYYGDGTSQDLGPIFSGNVNIDGNFTANSIVENMSGYVAHVPNVEGYKKEGIFLSCVKTGNKITFVISMDITKAEGAGSTLSLGYFDIPSSVGIKLIPSSVGNANYIDNRKLQCFSALQSAVEVNAWCSKNSNTMITFACIGSPMVVNTKYNVRYEATFLLNDNMVS